jgi:electron transport complex protein RnfD
MVDVVIALVPAMIAAVIFFRWQAVILVGTCVVTALITEWLCNTVRGKENTLWDFSAVVTAIILAFSVPAALPAWAAVIGTAFAIAIGKMVFGGLGSNIFNPAMVGRAFLTASFGVLMTTWTVPATIDTDMSKIGPENTVNARTQATPLAWSKEAIKTDTVQAEKTNDQLWATLTGEVGGCLGETSSLALILGGIYLVIRKTIDIRTPIAVIGGAFVFSAIFWLAGPDDYISPLVHLTTGGLLIGAIFIATDPVSAPLTPKGMWVFGAGIGIITVLIRTVGEYPEGVMYSVLLMNSVAPLLDRTFKWIPAGGEPRAE